jgi:hypothetical protein
VSLAEHLVHLLMGLPLTGFYFLAMCHNLQYFIVPQQPNQCNCITSSESGSESDSDGSDANSENVRFICSSLSSCNIPFGLLNNFVLAGFTFKGK